MEEDSSKVKRAKVARQSWEQTLHNWNSTFSQDKRKIILMNYLTGKQLEAGRDILKVLEKAYINNSDGMLYKELRDAVAQEGHSYRTIEEALRKLRREFIVGNESSWVYDKKHKARPKRRRGHKDEIKERMKSTMAGRWSITWHSGISSHEGFIEKFTLFQDELDKARANKMK